MNDESDMSLQIKLKLNNDNVSRTCKNR